MYELLKALSDVHLRGKSRQPLVANHRVAILIIMIHPSGFEIVETGM